MTFRPGDTIGDYKIIGVLGRGGMGSVFRVEHALTRRLEAMKILLHDQANQKELVGRFLREVQVQASLSHPNIASVHNAFVAEDDLVLVMELIEGESLESVLQRGSVPWRTAVGYACQALSALSEAHSKAIIHRDIKPSNIMITPAQTVKITDFGLAKVGGEDIRLTQSGAALGSVHYASPEQLTGSAATDGRSDLYSLGVVLYEMVTGCNPFDGNSHYAIMRGHVENSPIPPIERRPELPQALSDVILSNLAKKPGDRSASADGFLQTLERITSASDFESGKWRGLLQSRVGGAVGAIGTLALAAILVGHYKHSPAVMTPRAELHSSPSALQPVTLPAGTIMTVLIPTSISTSTHRRGQVFLATLKEPLIVGSETIAKGGAVVEGRVEEAEKGGRFKGRAHLVVRLTHLQTREGGVIGIASNTVIRQGAHGFVKHGAPAVLQAGTQLSFHTTSPVAVTPVSDGSLNSTGLGRFGRSPDY